MKTIYLAGGCFWGMQKFLDQSDGVISTEAGYANGPDEAPTYEKETHKETPEELRARIGDLVGQTHCFFESLCYS